MYDFSNLVGRTVFGSKPGDCIPILYLVSDDFDPNEPEGCYSVKATECQPKTNEYFCDKYLSVSLIPCVLHGVKTGEDNTRSSDAVCSLMSL